MECSYPAGSRSFEIDRASKGRLAAKERVNLFVREQTLHLRASIDQFLTGAPGPSFRRKMRGVFEQSGGMGFEGAALSGGLTRKLGLNFRPDVNGDGHALSLSPEFSFSFHPTGLVFLSKNIAET
jgi:hypothetical protein